MIQYFQSLKSTSTPFDDTIEFSVDEILNNTPQFSFLGNYLQNPINDKVLQLYMADPNGGASFGTERKTVGRISSNKWQTYGSQFDIYDPVDGGTNDCNGGYDTTGKLHVFCGVRSTASVCAAINEIRYFTSNDDGATISSVTTLPDPSAGAYCGAWPEGVMLENNGVLFKNYYKVKSDFTESGNYLLRSTDYGANWSTITIRSGAPYVNEADIVALSNTDLLVLLRDSTDGHYRQFQSDDNGLTWNYSGKNTFGESNNAGRPPCLRKFKINNQDVIVAYILNPNSTTKDYAVYATPQNLIDNGTSGWDLDTKLVYHQGDNILGHHNAVHFDDTLEAIMVTYKNISGSYTETYYMTMPTTQYQSLITELGL